MTDSQKGRIVVGFDGSAESAVAVDWAAKEAEQSHLSLTVLHVIHRPELVVGLLQRDGTDVLTKGALRARASAPSIDVTAFTCQGSTADTIITFAAEAELLVLGTRGHGDVAGTLLGSVAFAVTAKASTPVVVVRGESGHHPGPDRPVVVGIDGSLDSENAARYGALVAARAGAPLILVAAYPLSSPVHYFSAQNSSRKSFDTLVREEAERVTSAVARDVLARHPDVEVLVRAVKGPAAWVLTTTARDAALLVVGSRGLSGLEGLVLGSVSHSAIHSCPCPVAVLHG